MSGDDRSDVIINQAKPVVAAGGARLPHRFKLPENEELLIGPPFAPVVCDLGKGTDHGRMAAARRRHDKTTGISVWQ